MSKDRIPIPDNLAAEVLFASNRSCCVCRNPGRKVQIHHIDANPANNDFCNLAVICNDCHSDAHTTQAFARNLTPDLIRKYNDNWRAIVRAKLCPNGDAETTEYRLQVLLELGLLPHAWKLKLFSLYPGGFEAIARLLAEKKGDIWDSLKTIQFNYSQEEWQRYLPLFTETASRVVDSIDHILAVHGEAVPARLKTSALRLSRIIDCERAVYLHTPLIFRDYGGDNRCFEMRFSSVIDGLATYCAEVDGTRSLLEASIARTQ
jgi:hypothetical protein